MKKLNIFLLTLSIALILTASSVPLKDAMAYFTTYAHAEGGYTIELGSKTNIHEDFSAWTKHVVITNEEGQPVFVRVRIFCGSKYDITISDECGYWTDNGDGYIYYQKPFKEPLFAGESTEELLIKIEGVPNEGVDGESFNVVVVYESAPALYDSNGNAYADWDAIVDSGSTGSGEGGSD